VDMNLVFFPKSLSYIVCYYFQMVNNMNRCTISIQDIRNIFKRKAIWDEPIEKVQP
jgi:hypothetical protein